MPQTSFAHATPWLLRAKSPFVPPRLVLAANWCIAHPKHTVGILAEDVCGQGTGNSISGMGTAHEGA